LYEESKDYECLCDAKKESRGVRFKDEVAVTQEVAGSKVKTIALRAVERS